MRNRNEITVGVSAEINHIILWRFDSATLAPLRGCPGLLGPRPSEKTCQDTAVPLLLHAVLLLLHAVLLLLHAVLLLLHAVPLLSHAIPLLLHAVPLLLHAVPLLLHAVPLLLNAVPLLLHPCYLVCRVAWQAWQVISGGQTRDVDLPCPKGLGAIGQVSLLHIGSRQIQLKGQIPNVHESQRALLDRLLSCTLHIRLAGICSWQLHSADRFAHMSSPADE
jgi:hypothetical protein